MVTANGGNFWSTFYDEASFVDNIGDETCLEEVLSEDSLLQTFRSDDSPVLTEWLCMQWDQRFERLNRHSPSLRQSAGPAIQSEERNVRDLLLYLVREPKPDATHDEAHKFPFLVCELFSCEVRPLLEAVAKNESLLELLFSFVLEDGQKRPHPESEDDPNAESCNPVLAGYFSRLVCLLLNHFPGEVGIYVTARYDFLLQAFIQTMECRSILEVFTRIMTCRYPRRWETFPGARFLSDVLKVAAGAAPGAGQDHARNTDSAGEHAEAGKTASDPRTSHRILQQVPYLLEDLIAAEGTQAANDSLKTPPVGGAGVMGAATANGEIGPSSPKSDGTTQNGQQPSLPVPMLHELIKFRPATLLYSDSEDTVSAGVTLCSTIFHACLEADECAEAEEDEVVDQQVKVVDPLQQEQDDGADDGGNKMAPPAAANAKGVDYIGNGEDLESGQHDPSEPRPEEGEGDGAAPAASPQPSPEKMSPLEVAEKMMALEGPDGHRMTEEKGLSEEQKRFARAKRAEELQESLRDQPPPLRRLFAQFLRDFEACFEKIAARMKVLIQKAASSPEQSEQQHHAPEQSQDLP